MSDQNRKKRKNIAATRHAAKTGQKSKKSKQVDRFGVTKFLPVEVLKKGKHDPYESGRIKGENWVYGLHELHGYTDPNQTKKTSKKRGGGIVGRGMGIALRGGGIVSRSK